MATQNIDLDQGSDFSWLFELTLNKLPQDTTGLTVKSAMRRDYDNATAIPFTVAHVGSNVTISLTSAQTASLRPGNWVYDVIMINPGPNTVSRVVDGIVRVNPGVTFANT